MDKTKTLLCSKVNIDHENKEEVVFSLDEEMLLKCRIVITPFGSNKFKGEVQTLQRTDNGDYVWISGGSELEDDFCSTPFEAFKKAHDDFDTMVYV